ncbi:uncharacterized protein LOC120325950 [Styela clava]
MSENTILTALAEVFQQRYESEVVTELVPDRILQFIGVRLVLVLAIAAKLNELVVGSISCHPVKNETEYSSDFIEYCESYCWESPVIKDVDDNTIQNLCNVEFNEANGGKLLQQPKKAINVMIWMPYVMIFQAFLLSLPSAWWNLRVRVPLMEHLKCMKLFIKQIYEKVKDVPAGIYDESKYYDGSLHVSGCKQRSPHLNGEVVNNDTPGIRNEVNKALEKVRGQTLDMEIHRNDHDLEDPKNETTKSRNTAHGITQSDKSKMLDRHLFSMLCYENFSSLECYPYLLSISQLTFIKHFEDQGGVYPMEDAILHQWCHKENFSSRFLVIRYYLKHVFAIIISLTIIRGIAFVFEMLGSDIWESESFLCNVLYYENEYIVCTLHRKTEMLAFLVINFMNIVIYLIISSSHLYSTSKSRHRQACVFLEHIQNLGSISMMAALREMQDKK